MRRIVFIFCIFIISELPFADTPCIAQIHVAVVRPDRAAPGMNVVLEVLTLAGDVERPFGFDTLAIEDSVILVNPQDSSRVIFGPNEVSWYGRMVQIPLIILPNATLGPLRFYIKSLSSFSISDTIDFIIDSPQHIGPITHDTTIGGGSFGQLSAGNTIIVDSLIVSNSVVHFSLEDDIDTAGNRRYQPVTILSKGPVRLTNATISVDANGIDGGPGGGGGGHGFPGAGGNGFTGGGSCPSDSLANNGSDSASTLDAGGRAATGVAGGESDPYYDGGGGGTGSPFGLSGSATARAQSDTLGGYGGGSSGGENNLLPSHFGGGGGGFGMAGIGGADPTGTGVNGGNPNGGRFLVPLAGGSGGGAGNANSIGGSGGSGGGGGGSLAIIAFDSIVCDNAIFTARGDSGTSGMGNAAGGGGGSGGAIYLVSPKDINAANSQIIVDGGQAGLSGDSEDFAGGNGGIGRIRVDGPSNLTPNGLTNSVWTRGISISPTANVPAHGFVQLAGLASDTINTLDSIRIYYRTRYTGWSYIDTVRANNGSWSKWLPLSHDSLLFVAALTQVNGPQSVNYNYEPSWLMSHAGIIIVRHQASPFLVALDTLDFGTVRVSKCKTLTLKVENEGEEPLTLEKDAITGSLDFTVISDTPITIQPYAVADIQVQYCPDSSRAESATLSISSNDSLDSPKIVTLLGTGLARKDSLVISDTPVKFTRVLVGQCASDTIKLISKGVDTLYLDSSAWRDLPFSMHIVPPDTALATGDTCKLIVTFCPTDSGDFHLTEILDGREDSVQIDGHGVIRRAASKGVVGLPIVCLGNTVTFEDTITIKGNDTMTLSSIEFPGLDTLNVDTLLHPGQKYPVTISWNPADTGSSLIFINYRMADTTLTTNLSYSVDGLLLKYDSVLPFDFVCVQNCKTDSVILLSSGADTVLLSNFHLANDSAFVLLDSETVIPPSRNFSIPVKFCPRNTIEQFDTLKFIAIFNGCDSAISILLTGSGIDSGLAAESVDFDSVVAGDCRDSSIFVQNPCGPETIIDSVHISDTSFKLISLLPDTIPSDGSAYLYFKFCPDTAGEETDTIRLYPETGGPFTSILKGYGYTSATPWAHFTISSAVVQAGSQAVTTLTLDSSSLSGIDSVKGAFVFDPEVLSYSGSDSFGITVKSPDSAIFSTVVDFGTPGVKGHVTWNTLVGPHTSSAIGLVLRTDTPLILTVRNGEVSVTDCFGLDGNLSPGGSYALSPVSPDPVFDRATATLTLGNDGYAEAKICDMTGREIETILELSFQRGTYMIDIPTDGLSSGRYMIVVSSLGWRAAKPFVIDR